MKGSLEISTASSDVQEVSSGFKYVPQGLLQATDLQEFASPEQTGVDGMHACFASGGTCNLEIAGLVDALVSDTDLSLQDLQNLIASADWQKPFRHKEAFGASAGNAWRIASLLSEHKLTQSAYKGKASEVLNLLPLLEWVVHALRPKLPGLEPKFQSFLAACEVAKQYLALKSDFSGLLDGSKLEQAVSHHLQCYVAAYGEDAAKPKHHLSFHLGPQIEEAGEVVDCWAPERKNGNFKQLVNDGRLKALGGLERSALGRLLNMQRERMHERPSMFENHLGFPCYECPLLAASDQVNVKIAKWLQLDMQMFGVDDIIICKGARSAVKVVACVAADGSLATSHCFSCRDRTS